MKIMVINGPNLNMLGIREPAIYGNKTYEDLVHYLQGAAEALDIQVEDYVQSNHEGDLVDAVQRAFFTGCQGIVINPGAYTHTSIALLDAVKAVGLPVVEVHISSPDRRETFRKRSFIRRACVATLQGMGIDGYVEAMKILQALAAGEGGPLPEKIDQTL